MKFKLKKKHIGHNIFCFKFTSFLFNEDYEPNSTIDCILSIAVLLMYHIDQTIVP